MLKFTSTSPTYIHGVLLMQFLKYNNFSLSLLIHQFPRFSSRYCMVSDWTSVVILVCCQLIIPEQKDVLYVVGTFIKYLNFRCFLYHIPADSCIVTGMESGIQYVAELRNGQLQYVSLKLDH